MIETHISTEAGPADSGLAALHALNSVEQHVSEARRHIASLESQNATLRLQAENSQGQVAALEAEIAQLRARLEQSRLEYQQLAGEKANLEANHHDVTQQNARLNEEIASLHHEQKNASQAIASLHSQLTADDLPTLIIKLAMDLTGAQVGLFTEVDGDDTLAKLGFQDLAPFIVEALYNYSRQAAHSEAPVVENDGSKLPDGAQLVNLAALPVATQGKPTGVLLLANKRAGGFTEADTQLLLAIGQHAGIAIENARLHTQLNESYADTVAVLADAIEAKDAYTRGHCEDVARVAVEVAQQLGLSGAALEQVRYAALLHDVGKIGVPDGVLLKPGKLLPEEFSIIQRHARIGRDIVARVPALAALCEAILHHHERWDGSGYPDGLSGEGIPLVSRIIGAVDAYDAMTTPRPYRKPVSTAEALNEMRRCSGTQFDPQVVDLVTTVVSSISAEVGHA